MKKCFALFLLIFFSCTQNVEYGVKGVRSGNIYNDYIEEPLTDDEKKFEKHLELSNIFIDKIISNDINYIYENLIYADTKNEVSNKEITDLFIELEKKHGKIKKYKKMQWHFGITKSKKVYSIKIIKHEKSELNYIFIFSNNHKIISFNYQEKKGVNLPQFIE